MTAAITLTGLHAITLSSATYEPRIELNVSLGRYGVPDPRFEQIAR
jgi:hypothetical protein